MRYLSALFLCLLVGFGVLHKALIIGYFVHNRSYIAVELCENKAMPEKKCDGKCYLRKNAHLDDTTQVAQESSPTTTTEKIPRPMRLPQIEFVYWQQPTTPLPTFAAFVAADYAPASSQSCLRPYHADWALACGVKSAVFHPPVLG